MALLDEGHQAMFASRGSSLRDVALDLSGAAAAALVTWIIWPSPAQAAGRKIIFLAHLQAHNAVAFP